MKKYLIALCLVALCSSSLFAQKNPFILYAEGPAQVQDATGRRSAVGIGDPMLVNETLITGKGGRIQLKTADSVIDIREKTVFKLLESQKGGKKQNAYLCALGSIKVKVNKLVGNDPGPRIGTSGVAAGVRGTELDVYAGEDGSSLVLVAEGIVDVESQGKTVALNPNEAVEVRAGQAPGAKFGFRTPINYSDWDQGKFDDFEKDPVTAIKAVDKQINDYIVKINALWTEYKALWLKYEKENEKRKTIESEDGKAAGEKYQTENVLPISNDLLLTFTDLRFNALSAYSMRRFVAGRMYLYIRTKFISNKNDKDYIDFENTYNSIMKHFENEMLTEKPFGTLYPRIIRFIEEGNV